MRPAIVSIIFVVLILGAGFGISSLISSQKKPAPRLPAANNVTQVSYRPVVIEDRSANIEVNGRLLARDRVEIFSEVSATYKSSGKLFKEGTYFRKGEVLINMSDREFLMNLRAQKGSLMNQITLMLPDLKADYPDAFPKWDAYLGSIALEKPLPALPEASSEQESYFLTAKNIQNLYYSIQAQEARLAKYKIYAPFNGRISQSNITEGTLVRVGQKLGEFFNPYSYEMEASVNLRDIQFLKPGSTVTLTSEDIAGSWNGRVLRISDAIDASTQTVRIFISVSGQSLREGMYLKGRVKGQYLTDVATIDRSLLMDDQTVFVGMPAENDTIEGRLTPGTLRKVTVEALQYSDNNVLVRGIKDGAWLVTQTLPAAYDGMSVSLFQLQ